MDAPPGSVLFCCTMNAIRSPMAEGIMKLLHGRRVYVDSAGVRRGRLDPFMVQAMDEIGIDMRKHYSKTIDDLADDYFDAVVSLSPEAQHRAVELTRYNDCALHFWHMPDPSLFEGTRENKLEAYRDLRDTLLRKIKQAFPPSRAPTV